MMRPGVSEGGLGDPGQFPVEDLLIISVLCCGDCLLRGQRASSLWYRCGSKRSVVVVVVVLTLLTMEVTEPSKVEVVVSTSYRITSDSISCSNNNKSITIIL